MVTLSGSVVSVKKSSQPITWNVQSNGGMQISGNNSSKRKRHNSALKQIQAFELAVIKRQLSDQFSAEERIQIEESYMRAFRNLMHALESI